MYMCFSLSVLELEAFVDKMDDSPWKPILCGGTDLCYHAFPSLELDAILISLFSQY